MKHLRKFESYKSYTREEKYDFDKYPLNENLMDLFDKYSNREDIDWEDMKWVGDNDVKESLEMIKGEGEVTVESYTPRYIEHFDDLALVVFGYAVGLTGKYLYEYEIKVVDKSTKRTSQVGGGYGTSGIDFSHYDTLAFISSEGCPKIVEKDVISNVINEFRELIINNKK